MPDKIKGIVIREKEQGEMDKTLQILTESEGVVYVRARGVRKISSSNARSAQLFSYSDYVLTEKNGFYTLKEATPIYNFFGIRTDVVSYALACYLCDLSSYVNVGGDEGNEIMRLLLNALYAAEKHIVDPLIIKASFEFRLSALIGFAPDLSACPVCGTDADSIQDPMFHLMDGYIACAGCSDPEEPAGSLKPVSGPVLAALNRILESPVNKVFLFQMKRPYLDELSRIAEEYILMRLEHRIQTLTYFKSIMAMQ
ncbi:MAG: DNA repair protein RecO [Clostridia bacterium]|nr:DNA repair protein RecO [Clostridia bacterium]